MRDTPACDGAWWPIIDARSQPFPSARSPQEEYRCVVILTSQKTLPVSITIMSFLPASLGQKGLMTIPAIVGHLSQLLIDSAVVSYWVHQASWVSIDERGDRPKSHERSAHTKRWDLFVCRRMRRHQRTARMPRPMRRMRGYRTATHPRRKTCSTTTRCRKA